MGTKGWLLMLLLAGLLAGLVLTACGNANDDDDDDDDDDSAGDDDDSAGDCAFSDLCDQMIETGFFYEMDVCLDWFETEGNDDYPCEDYDSFYVCGCDCLGKSPANFEACLGECINTYCYVE